MPPRSTRSSGRAGRSPAGADAAAAPASAPASLDAQPEPSQLGTVSGSTDGVPAAQASPSAGADLPQYGTDPTERAWCPSLRFFEPTLRTLSFLREFPI